jgi:hypothetical protein
MRRLFDFNLVPASNDISPLETRALFSQNVFNVCYFHWKKSPLPFLVVLLFVNYLLLWKSWYKSS